MAQGNDPEQLFDLVLAEFGPGQFLSLGQQNTLAEHKHFSNASRAGYSVLIGRVAPEQFSL